MVDDPLLCLHMTGIAAAGKRRDHTEAETACSQTPEQDTQFMSMALQLAEKVSHAYHIIEALKPLHP